MGFVRRIISRIWDWLSFRDYRMDDSVADAIDAAWKQGKEEPETIIELEVMTRPFGARDREIQRREKYRIN